jgi:putative transposase
MPKVGSVVLQNYPHHVVQRGHNKQVVFAEEADYRYYLKTLEEFKDLYGVKVYGFCLMTNTHIFYSNREMRLLVSGN